MMNFDIYNTLPKNEKKQYQVGRSCPECKSPLVSVNGHSTGALHAMCPSCKNCPDCEEGE